MQTALRRGFLCGGWRAWRGDSPTTTDFHSA